MCLTINKIQRVYSASGECHLHFPAKMLAPDSDGTWCYTDAKDSENPLNQVKANGKYVMAKIKECEIADKEFSIATREQVESELRRNGFYPVRFYRLISAGQWQRVMVKALVGDDRYVIDEEEIISGHLFQKTVEVRVHPDLEARVEKLEQIVANLIRT